MAQVPPNTLSATLISANSNSQQQADGLPSYRIYADPQGSGQLIGPRAPGTALYGREINTPEGFQSSSPQDPTPSPLGTGWGRSPFAIAPTVPGMQQPVPFTPPPEKLLLEPSVYIPGQGWINSANYKQ